MSAVRGRQETIAATMWVDPGGVSGVCVAYYSIDRLMAREGASWESIVDWHAVNISGPDNRQLDEIGEIYLEMMAEVGRRNPAVGGQKTIIVTVGCEDFVVREFNSSRDFLKPVRLTAALERMWYEEGLGDPLFPQGAGGGAFVPTSMVYRQEPGDAKSVVTNERLKAWGFWTKGPDHARDATRHMLLHLRRMAQSGGTAR